MKSRYELRELLACKLFDFNDYVQGTISGGVEAPRILIDMSFTHESDKTIAKMRYKYPLLSNVGVHTYHYLYPDKEYIETIEIDDDYESIIDKYYKKLNPDGFMDDILISEMNNLKLKFDNERQINNIK